MRALLPLLTWMLAACAPASTPTSGLGQPGEYRCVAPTGAMNAARCNASGGACACERAEDIPTFIPACAEGVAPSGAWHTPADPARRRAARDRSFVGDRDATGPFCLPAPPR